MAERPRPVIQAVADDARLDEPLYAVNLLQRVRPWAYDLYNLLAYPVARRVGARALLKGVAGRRAAGASDKEADKEAGDEAGDEAGGGAGDEVPETLLIVGYPDALSFLRLASHPWFLLISALRKLGLDGFQFGFTRRFDGGPSRPPAGKSGQLLALFWPPGSELELGELRRRVSAAGSTLVFAGTRKAMLALVRGDGEPRPTRLAPPLPHEHVVVVTGHERTLTPLADDLPPGATLAVFYERRL